MQPSAIRYQLSASEPVWSGHSPAAIGYWCLF